MYKVVEVCNFIGLFIGYIRKQSQLLHLMKNYTNSFIPFLNKGYNYNDVVIGELGFVRKKA